jgi:hypothetical protein
MRDLRADLPRRPPPPPVSYDDDDKRSRIVVLVRLVVIMEQLLHTPSSLEEPQHPSLQQRVDRRSGVLWGTHNRFVFLVHRAVGAASLDWGVFSFVCSCHWTEVCPP